MKKTRQKLHMKKTLSICARNNKCENKTGHYRKKYGTKQKVKRGICFSYLGRSLDMVRYKYCALSDIFCNLSAKFFHNFCEKKKRNNLSGFYDASWRLDLGAKCFTMRIAQVTSIKVSKKAVLTCISVILIPGEDDPIPGPDAHSSQRWWLISKTEK
jgi:hypothetical protein